MRNLSASVRQRLLNYSKAQQVEANLIFARFAAERLLYRLAQLPYAERFVLKGAMLLPFTPCLTRSSPYSPIPV